jgi:8-oxo-dGTP diphosphatase
MGSGHDGRPAPDTDGIRRWQVAGGLLLADEGLLLVQNLRRDGRLDWSPPGGVIDAGEDVQGGLAREIAEETGLTVRRWGNFAYRVEVDFADLAMHMVVQSFVASEWSGELTFADPDGIVVDAAYHPVDELDAITARLDRSPVWVREPLLTWLGAGAQPGAPTTHRYLAEGSSPGSMRVTRVD